MPHLSIRHQSRMIALQTLYEWDFDEERNVEEILERNIQHSGFVVDKDFCIKMIKGVAKNIKKINKLITETAPEWPLEQIANVDRAVLRIGIYELIFDTEVPPKAVINEAVELGKEFGSENSGKFVNGVLGTVYRASERYEEEELVINAGGVVYREKEKELYFILVKNAHDKWVFPRGKVEENETWQETAAREIKEETGIDEAEVLGEIGEIKYTDKSEDPQIKKSTHFYLVKTEKEEIKKEESKDVKSAEWFPEEEVAGALGYPNLVDIFKKALEEIRK